MVERMGERLSGDECVIELGDGRTLSRCGTSCSCAWTRGGAQPRRPGRSRGGEADMLLAVGIDGLLAEGF